MFNSPSETNRIYHSQPLETDIGYNTIHKPIMDRACNFNKKTFSRQYNGRCSAYGAEQWICFTRLAPQTGSNTQAGNMWTADHLSIHAPARWANRIPKHFFLIKKEIIIPSYPLPFRRQLGNQLLARADPVRTARDRGGAGLFRALSVSVPGL